MAEDVWAVGERYEPYVGRWSRRVAQDFLRWLSPPADARWLDVGCGTGALTEAITSMTAPSSVTALDASAEFLQTARGRMGTRAYLIRGAADSLPLEDAVVDCVVSGLALNFFPDPSAAVAEMRRVTGDGGTIAAYVWDYADGMQMMRAFWDAAVSLDPTAQSLHEGRRFPLCQPEPLAALFVDAGLGDVSVTSLEVATAFADFDDYWTPFLGGQGPGPGYCVALPDPQRDRLRERLRETLPVQADGSIPLTARAWGIRGSVT
ncbi:MAG: class I SAM-dependent methyltransferase [Actinomycetes bacterium]